MDNYIIELRNKNYLNRIRPNPNAPVIEGMKNGEWTEDIDPITMEEGDTLICRNSFIDTKAIAEEKIIIEEDLLLKMRFMYYQMNWNGVKRKYEPSTGWEAPFTSMSLPINYKAGKTGTVLPFTNGKHHVACNKGTTTNTFAIYNEIKYSAVKAGKFGGFKIVVRFHDIQGTLTDRSYEIPASTATSAGQTDTIPVGICFDRTQEVPPANTNPCSVFLSINPLGKDANSNLPDLARGSMDGNTSNVYNNTTINGLGNGLFVTGIVFHPAVVEKDIILPSGNYNPADICKTINSLVTIATGEPSGVDASDLANNNLLIPMGGTVLPNQDKNNFIEMKDVATTDDDRYGFTLQGGNPPLGSDPDLPTTLIGASQFVMSYDAETTQKFAFDYMHMPIFSDAQRTTGDSEIKGGFARSFGWTANPSPEAEPENLPENNFRCTKNSGIMFESLQPASFWRDLLGFDLDVYKRDTNGALTNIPNPKSIVNIAIPREVNPITGARYTVNGLQAMLPFFVNPPIEGRNVTGSFVGVNATFAKNKNFQNIIQLAIPPITGETNSAFVTLGVDTTSISAGQNIIGATSGNQSFGYYLIEVSSDFENNYVNSVGNFNHMMAVVSRYYTKVNYVSSTSADSIIYTHKGSPQVLSSFKCRVLNSDKTLALNIGEDNTVILELVKAPKETKKK